MVGTTLGIYANIFLPELLNTILFIIFLAIITPYIYRKGRKLRKEEVLYDQKKNRELNRDDNTISSPSEIID